MQTEPPKRTPIVSLADQSPMTIADLMLLEVLARGHGTLRLEPHQDDHVLLFDGQTATTELARLPRQSAEATLVRLALIAGTGLQPPQVGRVRLRLASHQGAPDAPATEVLLCLRATSAGLGAELYALPGAHRIDDATAVAGIDGLPVPPRESIKYQVVGELGRGGMGIVYLARHVQLDKAVALKVLTPAMAQRRPMAAQFVIEARAACRARHPAIVDVTDFGRLADGRNYLVMERIEWPTLTERLTQGRQPPQRAMAIALDMARGLRAAHSQGVIHRDLKPANVFVSDQDQVKIGDFGLAQTIGLETSPPLEGVFFGTVPYMAPEQASNSHSDHRGDVYSFGCILHELFTGRPPYISTNSAEVIESHIMAPIPALTVDDVAIPDRLVGLHRALLGKKPEDRPDSFDTVIAELEACREIMP